MEIFHQNMTFLQNELLTKNDIIKSLNKNQHFRSTILIKI